MLQELTIEQQLKESELFYRNLIADSLDGILLTDENAIVNFSSPSVTKILGYESADINGKNVFDYVHPDDYSLAASAFFDEVKRSPRVKGVNIRLRKKDGSWLGTNVRGHNMLHNPHIGRI
ncbi:MAG: PAS domain S-box protein, partial [Bacteroidota bacterium]